MFLAVFGSGMGVLPIGHDLAAALLRSHPGDDVAHLTVSGFSAAGAPVGASRSRSVVTDDVGRTVVAWARLDNSEALGKELGLDSDRVRSATEGELLLGAYARWGRECASRVEGDFSMVVWDPRRRGVFAARDSAGVRPLFYAAGDGCVSFATTTACLHAIPGVDLGVRSEWLAQFIHRRSTSWDDTPFRGVRKLPPGHSLWVDAGGINVWSHHTFAGESQWEDERDPRWLREYRDCLFEAVSNRVPADGRIGVENSGGLDSSTLVVAVATLFPDRRRDIHTFGFATQADEAAYIAAVESAANVSNSHVWPQRGADAVGYELGWRTIGYPPEHLNSVSHYPIYESARSLGIRSLFSGHGGDEVVTQQARSAPREYLDRRRYRLLWRELRGRPHRRAFVGAREWWRYRMSSAPAMPGLVERLSTSPLDQTVLGAAGVWDRTVQAAQFDAPFATVNEFVLGARLSPATSTRTAECSIVAASFGVEYVWPLLDRRLIQQYLTTPTVWKFGEGMGRYLHRRAVADLLPAQVTWKARKSMGGRIVPPVTSEGRSRRETYPPFPDLHHGLQEILDPERWRHGPPPERGWVGSAPWQRVRVLNDWLQSRS